MVKTVAGGVEEDPVVVVAVAVEPVEAVVGITVVDVVNRTMPGHIAVLLHLIILNTQFNGTRT